MTANAPSAKDQRQAELDGLRMRTLLLVNEAFRAIDGDDATVCANKLDDAKKSAIEWRKVQCNE